MDDTDISDALLVPDAHEDSVDIYEGLDVGCFSSNAVKSPAKNSQLKDSMDLYEELVTEEQQSKETLYTELKSRFQAAQNQIKELRKRLEQMEIQNTGLNIENCRLKKNISALLRTARQEVTRKDAEIQRLNQRSVKGRHHQQSHVNNLWDQTPSSIRPPPPPPSSHLPPPPPPPPPLSNPPPLPPPPPRENQPSNDPPQRSRTENTSLTNQPTTSCSETRASKVSSHSHSKSSSRERDCVISNKQADYLQHSDCDKNKSKHREEKYQSRRLSDSTDRRSKSGSYPSKDGHGLEKNRSHKADKDTGQKHDSSSGKSRTYLNVEGHHRSDRTKSPPPDSSHSATPSDCKDRSRERRPDKAKLATAGSEQSASHSSKEVHSRDHKRTSDKSSRNSDSKDRKKSSSNQHTEPHAVSCKEREDERVSKDHKRKRERRREEEIGRKHHRSTSRERERRKSKDSHGKAEGHNKERHEKTHDALKRSSKDAVKSSVEENSPNRKLCFMETLNLTLSPIKKLTLPFDATQGDLAPVHEAAENGEGHNDSLQSMCVENMCVVDEAECSELEAELKGAHKDLGPDERCDDVKDAQEDDRKSLTETAAGTLVGDSAVQTTSAPRHPIDAAENLFTPKSPQSSSPVATEGKPALLVETDSITNTPGSTSEQHTIKSLEKGNSSKQAVISDTVVIEMKVEPPKTAEQKSFPVKDASPSRESPVADNVSKTHQSSPASALQHCLPAASSSPIHKEDTCPKQGSPKYMEAVSSTISLDSLPQEGLSLPEAIYVLTQTNEEAGDSSSSIAAEPSSSTGCIAVSKVSSTTEETPPPEKYKGLLAFTPKKSFSPGKSPENNVEPSSSVPLLHDEDSMMRTLNSLKRIPDAISPLRSPIRIAKRSHLHIHSKPGHVKSLQKDFSSTAAEVNSKKLDVNKENKYPGSPANHDTQIMADKVPDLRSRLSDTELEEGEILSESEEVAAGSPVPANKKVKLSRPVRNKPSPKPVLNRKSEDRCVAVKESGDSPGSSSRSPKSRFKTVCPAGTKASFSNIEEIMEMFKQVRTEIRKKYMKLHKTFPRKSFYGMMENFQESFLEFVDGAHFGQICNQAEELKSKLKKLIASVFGKVSNNGIVKRIFEQQAVDLKQKLWDFVDVQVEYLFKDVHTTLKSLCKPAQAEEKRLDGSDRVSVQPSVKKPRIQQMEAQSAPTGLNQIKPCAVVPYKTGLGSRGKDIRITHMEKDLHPTDGPNTQTVIDFLPPKSIPSTPEKSMTSLVVSQSGSLLDKTDFELLTEQQASSLTFNLVRDSQMGEIFKCLLQGSDLLENSGMTGDSTAWSLGTPRKDGERLISFTTPTKFGSPSKLLSPTKFNTPSKLIATWSSISPRKMSSPRSKDHIPLNPALFDESCLLEVPSDSRGAAASSSSGLAAHRSYSILAEDLAVSLTIPSPLKSDSHLSFLQPSSMSSMHIMSTPDSVISAHISEDALLDGEDATEQDIHLALDTDNSSCGSSSSSVRSVGLATSFTFKPDVPMQALVMEKSNDHFIVKIRQTTASANNTLIADETLSETLREEDEQHGKNGEAMPESQAKDVLPDEQIASAPSCALSEKSLSNFAESSEICQAATGSESRLSQDEGSARTTDKEEAITQQSSSNFCLSEEPRKLSESLKKQPVITPSEDSFLSGAQSSDHLFTQMSQTASGEHASADESSSQTCQEGSVQTQRNSSKAQKSVSPSKGVVSDNSPHRPAESCQANQRSRASPSDSEREGTELSESDRSLTIAEETSSTPEKDRREGRKRKKHQDKAKAKRSRKEAVESSREEEEEFSSKAEDNESKSPSAPLSPNNISAKNVVRKKGEVVMAWTRDEDRTILMELKLNGASRETFSALAEKLQKPSGQIAQRFNQLMKLFKKQEKMDT